MTNIKALELDKVLLLCSELAVCEEAKDKIINTIPAKNYSDAKHLLDQTSSASSLSIRFGNPALYTVKPCAKSLSRADRGAQLSTRELLDIALILRASKALTTWYKSASDGNNILENLFSSLNPDSSLEKEISNAILSEDEIADNASSELSDIRRKIRNSEHKTREVLEKITRSQGKFLQEQIVTMRNGRFVVPVRSEHKSEVKGLVHDTSSTGSTVFIEPMAVVELNNQIRELEIEQKKEIERILSMLSASAANQKDQILNDYEVIVELDSIFARCKLGDKMKASVPTLTSSGGTNLISAKHPLIDSSKAVPIDISIGQDFDTLVITGPNTGGKTVALKTIGLLTLMAQAGFMIPASSRSIVQFYHNILVDIGDEQSIEQSLSTFSGHMTNIVKILNEADDNSLVLIDELGAGTDPVEGAALAVAIISKLRELGANVVATTHYAEMKIFALQTDGVENASCEFDVSTLRPTYRLLIGTPGRSNAFAISRRIGISGEIIASAEDLVSSENRRFEEVVDNLEKARQALEQERKQAMQLRQQAATTKKAADTESKQLQAQQEQMLNEARDRSRTILERVRYQADQVLDELEAIKKQKDKENFSQSFSTAQRNIKSLLDSMEDIANPVINNDENYVLPRALKAGDNVFLLDFNTNGTVITPPDSKGILTVRAGILETKVSADRIRLLDKPKEKTKTTGGKVNKKKSLDTAESATGRLDLRGFDSQEAALELSRFIDYALLHHLKTLTIVHGKGTGVLRDMVQKKLKNNKFIESYRLGGYGEGGDGVTIAVLK